MQKLKPYAHYIIIIGLVISLGAVGQLSNGHVAWAAGTNLQTVPTRTPTPSTPDDNPPEDEDDSTTGVHLSQIIGVVTDLSTGRPGAGIRVRLNDIEVRTDSAGKYSLSGLQAGQFVISLVLTGNAVPGQEAITVTVDGQQDVVVDLTYYSKPSQAVAVSAQTETQPDTTAQVEQPAPAEIANSPAFLPTTGTARFGWGLSFGLGLGLLWLGYRLNRQETFR
jgi:hypothetical protein